MATKVISNRKSEIIEKATELFQKQGYAATSMRDLAGYIGMEAASLYSHIKSKEELLQIICFDMADKLFEPVRNIASADITVDEKLKKFVASHVLVLTSNTAAAAVFFSEWRHLSEPYLADFLRMREQYEGIFIKVLIEGNRQGVFHFVDAKFTVLALLSSINWLPNWYKTEGQLKPNEIAENVTDVFINGLKVRH